MCVIFSTFIFLFSCLLISCYLYVDVFSQLFYLDKHMPKKAAIKAVLERKLQGAQSSEPVKSRVPSI